MGPWHVAEDYTLVTRELVTRLYHHCILLGFLISVEALDLDLIVLVLLLATAVIQAPFKARACICPCHRKNFVSWETSGHSFGCHSWVGSATII